MIFGTIFSGIMANVQRRRADNERNKALNQLAIDESSVDNLFNAQYYKDFTSRADVQSMFRTLKEQQKSLTGQNRKNAAVMGGTEETVAAMQDNVNGKLADTYGNVASIGAQWKDSVYNNYMDRKSAIGDKRYGVYQGASNMFGNSANNMLLDASAGLHMFDKAILDSFSGGMSKVFGGKRGA
ncbi:MAG: hypothetical protein RR293_05435 [Bacteroidales bacterium]